MILRYPCKSSFSNRDLPSDLELELERDGPLLSISLAFDRELECLLLALPDLSFMGDDYTRSS